MVGQPQRFDRPGKVDHREVIQQQKDKSPGLFGLCLRGRFAGLDLHLATCLCRYRRMETANSASLQGQSLLH
jgi:hypothetical protein